MTPGKERYQLIDALRGLSIILMMAYHCGHTLYMFGLIPQAVLFNPLLDTLQPIFAGIFILLSGISSQFSHSNIRRGLLTLGCGAVVSIVTYVMGMPIWFGILHFLGTCMLLYGLFRGFLERIPRKFAFFLWPALFIICFQVFPLPGQNDWFSWLGICTLDFSASVPDYFPLARWLFLFLWGTWLGTPIKARKFPHWFYGFHMPFLPFVGRHTLLLYMIHQPIFYGLILLFTTLFK